jgi:hypothetical protein
MTGSFDREFVMDPPAMWGISSVQVHILVHGVFAKELPSLNFRTGALNLIIAPVYVQWVKCFTPIYNPLA